MEVLREGQRQFERYFPAFVDSLYDNRPLTGHGLEVGRGFRDFHTLKPNKEFPWPLFVHLTITLFLINWALRLLIVIPSAKFILSRLSNGKFGPRSLNSKAEKFAQAHIEMLVYSLFAVLGTIVISHQNWFLNWNGAQQVYFYWWTDQPTNSVLDDSSVFFYVAYAARYTQQFISVFFEAKRKDFWEMQIHHLSTAVLTIMSFSAGYVKIGLVIMVLMDYADPFLHAAKQLVYLRGATGSALVGTVADAMFGLFALDFTVTRMVLYPIVVFSIIQGNLDLRFKEDINALSATGLKTIWEISVVGEKVMIALAVVLLLLQCFWFSLLAKIVFTVLSGQDVGDDRSDTESDLDSKKKQ